MRKIERSREVRQWLKLFTQWLSLGVIIDSTVNDGKNIKKAGGWIKDRWSALKNKFKKQFSPYVRGFHGLFIFSCCFMNIGGMKK